VILAAMSFEAKRVCVDMAAKLLVKRLSPNASLPQRCSPHAAGYDLFRWACLCTLSLID
jgi:dUTPase